MNYLTALTLAGATLTGTASGNYTLTSVSTTTANITALGVTGTYAAANKTYNGNPAAVLSAPTVVTPIGNDDVSLTGGTGAFNNKNVGLSKPVTVSGATLTGADSTNYSLDEVTANNAAITALGVTGTYAAASKTYDGNLEAALSAPTVVTPIGSDDVSLTGGTGAFNNKNVGPSKPVTVSSATLTGTDATNYSLGAVTANNAAITALHITGALTVSNKIYDGTTTASVLTRSTVGDVGGVSLTSGTAAFADKNVGTGKTVTLTGASLSGADVFNYVLDSVATTTANNTQAGLSITASDKTKTYGDTLIFDTTTPSSDFSVVGLISDDNVASVTLTSAGANGLASTGIYDIVPSAASGTGLGNYNISYTPYGKLTVVAACVVPPGGTAANRFYIGTKFAWTTSPTSSTASLTLSAGLRSCTDLGDIRTARVTFATRNSSSAAWTAITGAQNLPVGLVDPGNIHDGTATAIVQWNIGSLSADSIQIAIIVSGNYLMNEPATDELVTISKPPATSSILGGASIANGTDSRGFLKGAPGEMTQFFFNVKYTKSGSNPQGKVSMLVSSLNKPDGTQYPSLHTYRITSTAISVLAANTTMGTATFSSKCNIIDLTTGNGVDSGVTMQITMTDGGKGIITNPLGLGDTVSLYILNKNGGVWFANKLDASLKAVESPVVLGTGDLVVK